MNALRSTDVERIWSLVCSYWDELGDTSEANKITQVSPIKLFAAALPSLCLSVSSSSLGPTLTALCLRRTSATVTLAFRLRTWAAVGWSDTRCGGLTLLWEQYSLVRRLTASSWRTYRAVNGYSGSCHHHRHPHHQVFWKKIFFFFLYNIFTVFSGFQLAEVSPLVSVTFTLYY